jgi:predicted AlkP superfamily pyrophosphatase or phosphodiesterase
MKKLLCLLSITLLFACEEEDNNHNQEPYRYPDVIVIDSLKIDRKVLIIGIDGFRSDVMQESISPFIYGLSQNNNVYCNLNHIVEGITSSGPNWSSLLTGVHLEKHNVTNNNFENDNYNNYPPFFHYIETADNNIQTASIVNWTPINNYIMSDYADFVPVESINDSTVFENAKKILLNTDSINADILFLHFDELDGAGHTYGYSSLIPEYINTVNILDFYAENLFDIIENRRSNGEDWMYFIISDHGGDGTGHGDANNPNINTTIFLAEHPFLQLKANCCYTSSQADLASTVLDFLGILSSQFEYNTDGVSILE